jgi:hypothetical protein
MILIIERPTRVQGIRDSGRVVGLDRGIVELEQFLVKFDPDTSSSASRCQSEGAPRRLSRPRRPRAPTATP